MWRSGADCLASVSVVAATVSATATVSVTATVTVTAAWGAPAGILLWVVLVGVAWFVGFAELGVYYVRPLRLVWYRGLIFQSLTRLSAVKGVTLIVTQTHRRGGKSTDYQTALLLRNGKTEDLFLDGGKGMAEHEEAVARDAARRLGTEYIVNPLAR